LIAQEFIQANSTSVMPKAECSKTVLLIYPGKTADIQNAHSAYEHSFADLYVYGLKK
jgi:hypothetical protein